MSYEYMEEAVAKLCDSLENDPDRWLITTYTLIDQQTGVEYWISGVGRSITQTWNGRSENNVFSSEQGERIYDAFCKMRKYKASVAQEKVLLSMCPPPETKSLSKRFLSWIGFKA